MSTGKYRHQIRPQLSKIHEDPEMPLLVARRHALVVVVTGLRFAGKSTAATHFSRLLGSGMVRVRPEEVGELGKKVRASIAWSAPRRSSPPATVIDGLGDKGEFEAIRRFFIPAPRIFEVNAPQEVRLDRAMKLDPEGGWTQEELSRADEQCTTFEPGDARRATGLKKYLDGSLGILKLEAEIESALAATLGEIK